MIITAHFLLQALYVYVDTHVEANLGPCETTIVEHFAKIAKDFYLLTVFTFNPSVRLDRIPNCHKKIKRLKSILS